MWLNVVLTNWLWKHESKQACPSVLKLRPPVGGVVWGVLLLWWWAFPALNWFSKDLPLPSQHQLDICAIQCHNAVTSISTPPLVTRLNKNYNSFSFYLFLLPMDINSQLSTDSINVYLLSTYEKKQKHILFSYKRTPSCRKHYSVTAIGTGLLLSKCQTLVVCIFHGPWMWWRLMVGGKIRQNSRIWTNVFSAVAGVPGRSVAQQRRAIEMCIFHYCDYGCRPQPTPS